MINSGTPLLDEWTGNFSAEQTEAYEYDGHCAVLAGPGSGKTRVLVAKVVRLLTQRANGPRGVACVTFNNEAVNEMRNRFRGFGFEASDRLFVGTVHSFCLARVLRPFVHLFREDLNGELVVAGDQQKLEAVESALDMMRLGGRTSEWQNQMDAYRRTHPFKDSVRWDADEQLARLVEIYEENLHSQGLVDFDDMVLVTADLLRHNEFVRKALEARFPFLVVDEYQDLGYPLHAIVKLLMHKTNIEIFVVGDPDQSIYGFAGADPGYLRSLAQDPVVHQIQLNMNYRSAQRIIDGSQKALALDEPRDRRSAREDIEGEIAIIDCPDGLGEQAHVIVTQLIPRLSERGVPYGDIAVLYIDRWDQLVLSQALDNAQIKYAGEKDRRYPRTPFTRWLEDVAAWCTMYPNTQLGPRFQDLIRDYAEMRNNTEATIDVGDLSDYISFFGDLKNLAKPNIPLSEWLKQIDAQLDLDGCLRVRNSHPDDFNAWNALRERCQDGEILAGFRLNDFARCSGRLDTVTLSTLHSSKGLEYKVVIIPGLEEGRLPGYRANTAGALAEARRVFYVGMTRAKDKIYLLHSGWYMDGYDRVWKNGPSRFIKELRDNDLR